MHTTRHAALRARLGETPCGSARRAVEVAREEQGPCVRRERAGDEVVHRVEGELDGAGRVGNRLLDAVVDGERGGHERHAPRVRVELRPARGGSALGEPEKPAPLGCVAVGEARGKSGRCGQHGIRDDALVRYLTHPVDERPPGSASDQPGVVLDQDPRNRVVIARRRRVRERLDRHPVPLQPFRGAAVVPLRGPGIDRSELCPREVGEERVDPIPAGALESLEECVRALERVQQRPRIVSLEHVVAELRRQLPEHASPLQHRPTIRVERGEHLAAQVLGHELVLTAERAYGRSGVLDRLQPEAGENERRDPAFGALHEHLDLEVVELEAAACHQELARLGGGERERVGSQLGELSARAQAGEAERGIGPGDEDQPRVQGKLE